MANWKIFKNQSEYIIVHARTFSEALSRAKLHDPAYCGGYMVDDDED